MAAILVILFSVILSSMTPLVFEASDQLIPIVFEVDKTLGQYLSTASSTIYNIGISLMILKFLKKGFEIYVMGTDGDPDMDPLQLVTNFIKASNRFYRHRNNQRRILPHSTCNIYDTVL